MVTTATRTPITPEEAARRRREKAQMILDSDGVKPVKNGYYVRAQSGGPNVWYFVSADFKACTCEDAAGRERLGFCKHTLAARLFSERNIEQPETPLTDRQKLTRAKAFVMVVAEATPMDEEDRSLLKDAVSLLGSVLETQKQEADAAKAEREAACKQLNDDLFGEQS